jgi:hypothetical protein
MSEDIVTSLRYPIHRDSEDYIIMYAECRILMNEAADEIERLRKALKVSDDALEECAKMVMEKSHGPSVESSRKPVDAAEPGQ